MQEHRFVLRSETGRLDFLAMNALQLQGRRKMAKTLDIEIDDRPFGGHNALDQAEDFVEGVFLIALTNGYS
jgi:hypothetical protein